VTEWLENPDPLMNADDVADETWRASLLLQVILMIAGDVPSSLTNLVERYMEPLRTHSATEQGELALVSCLGECLNHEPGYFHQALDILLRRSIITVTAAAKWTSNEGNLSLLALHTWPYKNLELVANRALDIAKVAVLKRRDFGEDMPFDKSTDTLPLSHFLVAAKSLSEDASAVMETGTTAGSMEVDEEATQSLNSATEAVVAALRNAREVHATFLGNLARFSNAEATTEAWLTSAASLCRQVCSSYDISEKLFLQVDEVPVLLADKAVVNAMITDVMLKSDSIAAKSIEKIFKLFF
jgi:hypothetical protein